MEIEETITGIEEMISRRKRRPYYCMGAMVFCAGVYGAAYFFGGPTWVAGAAWLIGGVSFFVLVTS